MRKLKLYIIILCFLITQACLANDLPQFSQMVVFGDSYSDNGNTFRASSNTYPGFAYSLGRFSNGPTWSEYLATKLGFDPTNPLRFRNYAYGEGQIKYSVKLQTHELQRPAHKWTFSVPDLSGEIDTYLTAANLDSKHSLYFIFIGTNDFLNQKLMSDDKDNVFVQERLQELFKQTDRLIQLGARNIVIFNMRSLTNFPLAKQFGQKYQHGYLKKLQNMLQTYNKLLIAHYAANRNVLIYNTYHFDEKLFQSTRKYKWYRHQYAITEKNIPCYVNKGDYIDRVGERCAKPWQYLFYDRVHLTTYINKLMSDDIDGFLYREKWIG